MKRLRLFFCILVLASLLPAAQAAHAAPAAQTAETTLRQCNAVAEETLLDELNAVSQQVFADALKIIDVAAIVAAQWDALKLDAAVDSAVDAGVQQVKNETDYWNRFLSGWSAEMAKELATAVANKAFASPAFHDKLDKLSGAVAAEIGKKVGDLSAESVSAAFYCLQTFIGGNYAQVLKASFEEQLQGSISAQEVQAAGQIDTGILAIIEQHKVALGGVGVIIAAQITRRLLIEVGESIAKRVASRIVGRVLGRVGTELVPIAGWLIGAGLIVYDVYNGRDGALPQIQATLKSSEVKAGIRGEVVASIEPELAMALPEMARAIANDLYSEWRDTKHDIRQVLDLAAENEAFRSLLQGVENTQQLSKLVALVSSTLATQGRPSLESAVTDGSLQRALSLPASAAQLVTAIGTLSEAVTWGDAAGELLDQVVALEIYKHLKPGDLDRAALQQLVDVGDKAAIANLLLLEADVLKPLLDISSASLKTLAAAFTPDQLAWLASTVAGLSAAQRDALLARLVSNPALVGQIQGMNLLGQIGDSDDLDAWLGFLAAPRDLPALAGDVMRLLSRSVSLRLFAAKYGWPTTLGVGLLGLLLILVVIRLIYDLLRWLLAPFGLWRGGRG